MTRDERLAVASVGVGGTAGAAAGGTSAVLGVFAAAAPGTAGAAALTSGLAALGSIVGGGMLTGLCIVAAAPVAGFLSVGAASYGVYRLYKVPCLDLRSARCRSAEESGA